jgi:HPt (histidine-containing phosphotransfer) domain-containing protein
MKNLLVWKKLAQMVPNFLMRETPPIEPPTNAGRDGDPRRTGPLAPVFDQVALLASMDGNRALVREMVRLCLEVDAPRLLGNLREGLEKRDFRAVEEAAHGLKGLVGEFHAPAVYAAARQLEETARERRADRLPQHGEALLHEFQRLADGLREFAPTAV